MYPNHPAASNAFQKQHVAASCSRSEHSVIVYMHQAAVPSSGSPGYGTDIKSSQLPGRNYKRILQSYERCQLEHFISLIAKYGTSGKAAVRVWGKGRGAGAKQ